LIGLWRWHLDDLVMSPAMWAAKIAWWASRHARNLIPTRVKRNGPGLGGRRGQFEANVMARTMAVICESRATVFQKNGPELGGSRRGQFTEVPVTVWTMTGVCESRATIKWPQPKLWLMKKLGRGPVYLEVSRTLSRLAGS
jgi:hypothetical protein